MWKFVVRHSEQLFANQLGDPKRFRHIGDHVIGIPKRTFGKARHNLGQQSVDAFTSNGRDWEISRHIDLISGACQLSDDVVGRCDVGLIHDNDCVRWNFLGNESVARTDRRCCINHKAHDIDTAGHFGSRLIESLAQQCARSMDTGGIDENDLRFGTVQDTTNLRPSGLRFI
ncbi:unannotated protein [freshwater metagenome]|uniref:Unannotated protein n=1 Tax=freshwater metagenome TaxID=449393 RepID=A0A6J6LJT5_9ZZZZ